MGFGESDMGKFGSRRQKVDNFMDGVGHAVDGRGRALLRSSWP